MNYFSNGEVDIKSLIPYQFANNLNKATQGFYIIQGIIEKGAYEANIGNLVNLK